MDNREAIEWLKYNKDELLRYADTTDVLGGVYESDLKPTIEALDMAISALEKQEGKKPIGIKVEGKDPYTEVANIVDDWCKRNYYGSAFVTLFLDGRVTTEYLSFNGNDMGFEWDMDWWEGERDVVLLGFRMRSDVMFYGYPNSEEG